MDASKWKLLREGTVIPAHPLALTDSRKLDEKRQRALTRYYMESGAGGMAVGVHTTQFEIRKPEIGLFEPVLRMAAEETADIGRPFLKIAGVCGPLSQALEEAIMARNLGYDLVLVSNGGLTDYSEDELLERTRQISEILPVFGFYLQPSVGGRVLSYHFWRKMADLPGVAAIKMAPFNRYQTLDVARAVCHSERRDEIALYTGNDDNIVADLLTSFRFTIDGRSVEKEIAGGLLGHWAVWTQKAVGLLEKIKTAKQTGEGILELLAEGTQITDANAAFFDSANQFRGCIAGINEVLKRQGLMEGNWCLDPEERLSTGQAEEISRVYSEYTHLHDDDFIRSHLNEWTGSR
ncbi:dihydrodipicolinate synthase family protein [Bacillus sp. FJAT-42376]|uniref:dihydrodipicolinate synthase family protein n=1 Tax=Bacillus sp. FJAT-42376 TaxID=2014076 RepID=UPI000F4E6558|nr:dihydrodipicolinate synthase family protein [Bacillus sp. FJAT-42376]AZB42740.1 dihydrodipicolinate synthase family protein [Bacillus sp. FJAT-42376]